MSERKERFTPGPWMLTYRQSRWGLAMDIDGGPDGDWVARLGMTDESEVGRANAALLLAAPEMYELLDRIKGRLEFCKLEQSIDAETEHEIGRLMAKARGDVENGK